MLDTEQNQLMPGWWEGENHSIQNDMFSWLRYLPKKTYCSLGLRWPSYDSMKDSTPGTYHLPDGYDLYVISFYMEALDIQWIEKQCNRISQPIILLSDNNYYDWNNFSNLHCYTFYSWHKQLEKMEQWFPKSGEKNLRYKFSTFCNRLTQSKILVFTQLLEHNLRDHCLVTLSDWYEDKNLHHKEKTGIELIDNLSDMFFSKHYGKKISYDHFTHELNYQRYTANPWTEFYQSCALHFNTETFHYSYMQEKDRAFTHPGPFLTEKTFKCLLGMTGFVIVSQFDVYGSLSRLGFNFEYGFDTSWDADKGNLSRLVSILGLIEKLSQHPVQDLYEMTKESSQWNRDHILSGSFKKICQDHNDRQINDILEKFSP